MNSTPSNVSESRLSSLRFWVFVAILGSVLFHLALWFWFQRVYLPETSLKSNEELLLRKFNLERVEIHSKWLEPKLPPPEHVSTTPSPDRSSLRPTEEKRSFAQLLSEAPSSPTMPAGSPKIPQEKPVPSLGELESTPLDASIRSHLDRELHAARERPSLRSKALSAGRPILDAPGAPVAPKPGATELAPPTQTTVGPSQGAVVGEGGDAFTGSSRLDDFFGPGGLPLPAPPTELPKAKDAATLAPQSLLKDKPVVPQKLESLNPFLNVDLFTYERRVPSGKREGYFLIRIMAKPNSHLRVIPKDVYFVMDISSSIGGSRLKSYTDTVLAAIPQMNAPDRFKILAFRDKLLSFSDEWTPVQNAPMTEVKHWLDDLDTGGVTDFYDGLQPLTRHPPVSGRMAMAVVMSDGVPTKGQIDSAQIIRELSEENDDKTSIFTLSNGHNVNNFLLDFLSYGNQGRLRYSKDVDASRADFLQLIQQIQNPLFLDLRIRFAGVDGDQVYPQNLPNLYQDSPLLLFGRYTPGQTAPISLQILGESFNSTKELLVQLPIPKMPNGPEILPSTWARQRIYHLLGRMTRSRARQDAALAEIREISEEYKIEAPYF